jgi:circadian clock protein KaiC
MDTWISLTDVEASGERNRVLHVLKSRGMHHSNQVREYRLTDHGIELIEPYVGVGGVLTGSARLAQEAREREEAQARQRTTDRKRRDLERKRLALERQITELRAELEAEEHEVALLVAEDEARETSFTADRTAMAVKRGVVK